MNDISPRASSALTPAVLEEAAHWWLLLNDGSPTPAQQREFSAWVARSPERIEAYLHTARLHRALVSPAMSWPATSAEELIRAARTSASNVALLDVGSHGLAELRGGATGPDDPVQADQDSAAASRASWTVWRFRSVGIAATLLLAVLGVIGYQWMPERYETRIGEQRSVLLTDGSVVTLNTASRVDVRWERERRIVRLRAGEALFAVAPDAQRPFYVEAGHATVRAVGTQFNVNRSATDTIVTVLEGKVEVRSGGDPDDALAAPVRKTGGDHVLLASAERVRVTAGKVNRPERLADVATVTAWTQRQLVFDHATVFDVAAEFNRYNPEQIRIESPTLGAEPVTGVFAANDPESFIAFLTRIPGVTVAQDLDGTRRVVHDPIRAPTY